MNGFGRLIAGVLGLAVVGGAVWMLWQALTGAERTPREARRQARPAPQGRPAVAAAAPAQQVAWETAGEAESGSFLFDRWPRFACRHPWVVIAGAVTFVIVCGVLWGTMRGEFGTGSFTLPGTESQELSDLLDERFPQVAGDTTEIVFRAPAGITSPEVQEAIEALLEEAAELPQVLEVASPYEEPGRISPDGTIARATAQYEVGANEVDDHSIEELFGWRERVSRDDLQVELGGIVATAGEREPPGSSELVGLAAAVVILLIAFGSVTAAGLPIFTALLALIPAFFLIGVGAGFVNFASFTPQFAAMIGIGVGIDYALLVVTRFREALTTEETVTEAVVKAAGTAGHSVLFAGCSVVIALMGLWAMGIPLLSLTAMGPAIAVGLAALVALFVLPAILSLVGHRVNRLRVPGIRVAAVQSQSGMGYWLARRIQRAPWLWLIVATGALLVLAYPALDVRLGSSDAGSNPTSLSSRRSYDLLAEGFGAGYNGPIVIAAAFESEEEAAIFEALPVSLAAEPNVAGVAPALINADRTAGRIVLIPGSSPQDEETGELVHHLRDSLPELTGHMGVEALVGGPTAIFIDIGERVQDRVPVFLGAVIGASFLLLMVVFRSLLVPVKAALMNVLAAGSAFGILVAIFQWGWGGSLIGLEGTGPIESFLPMMMFAVLFGLSMDYEVFLVSRVREEYLETGDNAEAVARGLAATSRVISAAAAIMVAVFLSFSLSDQRVVKEFGIGLAVAIFLDATVIRLILVPAAMQLMSDANWWLPGWLNKILPGLGLADANAREPLPGAAVGE
ncbi:MAG: MMPL family transporter [Chloroflexota bacterium]|nr:MMPL family transporter [Chloroflexota bacterium]